MSETQDSRGGVLFLCSSMTSPNLMVLNDITNFHMLICSLDLIPEFQIIQSLIDIAIGWLIGMSNFTYPIVNSCFPLYSPTHFCLKHASFAFISLSAEHLSFRCSVTHFSFCYQDWRCHQNQNQDSFSLPPTFIFFTIALHWQILCGNQMVREK